MGEKFNIGKTIKKHLKKHIKEIYLDIGKLIQLFLVNLIICIKANIALYL